MVSGWGTGMHSRVQTFFENGIGSYAHVSEELRQKAERDGEKEEGPTMCTEKGSYLTAGAVDSGLTQSGQREAGNRPTMLQKASQPQTDLK